MNNKKILEPVTLGRHQLANRIVLPPLTRQRSAQPGDVPTDLMAQYYSQRAGAGFMVSEGTQVGDQIRVTSIAPGAVDSDLKHSTSGTAAETVMDFYKQAIPAASVARAVAFAIEQPADVDINEIVLRPTRQVF
jgi:2,4-dienoyl-CoA reductase-like NADH-dependent reductase (Old Yellow Enzyme family)